MLQLEPMPALERRWIHLTLRDNPDVATQSIGEEPNRRVVLVPAAAADPRHLGTLPADAVTDARTRCRS